MKILLFTPVSSHSAIARVSALVVKALREEQHEIVVVSTDEVIQLQADRVADLGRVVPWSDDDSIREALADGAIVAHQVGDSYRFHAGSVYWLDRIGGIVLLHDHFLGSMFLDWAVRGNEEAASRVIEEWYGQPLEWFFGLARSGGFIEQLWPTMTFVEWIVSKSDGVITHSDNRLSAILEGTGAPVSVVPLPYDFNVAHKPRSVSDDGTFCVLTFGSMNANKQVDSVIDAIGRENTLRKSVRYRLAGAIESRMRTKLTDQAAALQVSMDILGPVSSLELAHELDRADVVVCLRLPSLEAASASAIEAMLVGKLVIVADTGFYSSLPDDVVLKADVKNLVRDVSRHLKRVASSPGLAAEFGARATAYAHATFRADRYAAELLAMGARVERNRAVSEAMKPTGQLFAEWNVSPLSSILASSTSIMKFFTLEEESST
jgi:glycosyltransferase involved in cell wall biosynthesis